MTRNKTVLSLSLSAALAAAALAAPLAHAADPAASQPVGVVGLTSTATAEVTKDMLSVALTTTREGQEAGQVQAQLKQALDAALAEAKKAANPGQIDVQTGNFSLFPRYTKDGKISGWQGTAELLVEGRDVPGIAKLTSRITTLTIGRVGTNLSREQREKIESTLAAQAIASYRTKAAEISRQFGYTGYVIREVNVGGSEPIAYAAAPMMRAKAMGAADESLPVELGKSTVTITVNGTVQMTK